ncbi:hypothetical protein [Caulobacter sp. UC70_42]|uniref:hypothetical protein n=1 Tax=Caulobacter sp. UC70_42 TaxID=3374551 RepID=UPI003758119A
MITVARTAKAHRTILATLVLATPPSLSEILTITRFTFPFGALDVAALPMQ